MNPNGPPQPGQNNYPPSQPPQPGPIPPASNPYVGQPAQPTTYPQQIPQPQSWSSAPQPAYGQPVQPTGYTAPQPAGPAPYTPDYLDQIAPKSRGASLMGGHFTWIIIGLAILFMFAVSLLTLTAGNSNTATAQSAYLRVENISPINDKYRRYLKSNQLVAANANLRIFFSNAQRDLAGPLNQNGVDLTKINKEAKAKETSAANELSEKLEDARLNAILDRTYAREMAYQTQLLLEQYNKMTKNQSKAIADNAKKTIPYLEPLQKSLAEFDESKD